MLNARWIFIETLAYVTTFVFFDVSNIRFNMFILNACYIVQICQSIQGHNYQINRGQRGTMQTPSKAPVVSLSQKHFPHCSVLVASRNRLNSVKTKKLKQST